MLLIDYAALGALVLSIGAWFATALRVRLPLVAVSALLAIAFATQGVIIGRWQLVVALLLGTMLLLAAAVALWRKRGAAPRRPWVSGILLTVLLLLALLLPWLHPAPPLPVPDGPYAVGVRDFALADEARLGVLAAGDDEARTLLLRVWYPAADTDGHVRRPYFTAAEAETTAVDTGALIGMPFYFTYLGLVQTNSYVDAPLIDGAGPLPVVIYSHGYTSFAGQNTALMETLASHGYLVFSVQHSHDSASAVLPDGRVIAMDPALVASFSERAADQAENGVSEVMVQAFTGVSYAERRTGHIANRESMRAEGERIATLSAPVWLEDRRFVLDALAAGAVPAQVRDLVQAGDFERTGQMGMSFGGSTTGGFCLSDRRCAAGVNLDGGDYHTPMGTQQPVPFLMFYSDIDRVLEQFGAQPGTRGHGFNDFFYERHELIGLNPDITRLRVRDVMHLGVSDFTLFLRNPLRGLLLGPIDADAMIAIQNDFVLAFFDRYLRGRDSGFPAAQFAQHDRWVEPDSVDGLREWWLAEHPEDRTVQVLFETDFGEVEMAIYPERAPVSAQNFLRYVEAGHYDGASFYRSTRKAGTSSITVLQGGLLAETMAGDGSDYAEPVRPLPPIPHETTTETGIPNERGTLAYARLDPGTAGSEIFFNLEDNPVLDHGVTAEGRDGYGYATFGRVLRGMRVLEAIAAEPTDGQAGMERLRGQILREPVIIRRASLR